MISNRKSLHFARLFCHDKALALDAFLKNNNTLSAIKLTKEVGFTHLVSWTILHQMYEEGLVEQCPVDRREIPFRLTTQGLAVAQGITRLIAMTNKGLEKEKCDVIYNSPKERKEKNG